MNSNFKDDIVTSLNAMDEVEIFKVLNFIQALLSDKSKSSKKSIKEKAIMEIRLALKENRPV